MPVAERIAAALAKLALALRHQQVQGAGERGLSPTQGQIVATLADGALRPSALAERLALSAATVSESVGALVSKGLVRRHADPDDARATRLDLTASGRTAVMVVATWPDFLARAVDTLAPGEQEVFLLGVIKMIATLEQRGQIPLSRMCVTCTHFQPGIHAGARPHHCGLLDAPLGARELRVDCAEHEPAEAEAAAAVWRRFVAAAT